MPAIAEQAQGMSKEHERCVEIGFALSCHAVKPSVRLACPHTVGAA